jgi:hypothetical protein
VLRFEDANVKKNREARRILSWNGEDPNCSGVYFARGVMCAGG